MRLLPELGDLFCSLIWGLRLSGYLSRHNWGKREDFRYKEFRKKYGEKRYWWISFFQTFMLQGILMWLISAPLLGAEYYGYDRNLGILDFIGMFFWITGILFEAGGDYAGIPADDPADNKSFRFSIA